MAILETHQFDMPNYKDRMQRVITYIYQHLEDSLTVETLSAVACFSKYHFHRQFSAHTGVNVHKYVQLIRLKRASYQLAFNPELKIIDIALGAGFESHESFSRSFKKIYAHTPSQFRNNPQWQMWLQKHKQPKTNTSQESIDMNVSIVQFMDTKIAVKQHEGPVESLNDSITSFITWRKSTDYSPVNTSKTFGLAYDDPENTKPDDFRFDVCGEVTQEVPENPQGVINKTIPAGRCAVLRHEGSHDLMDEKIRWLYVNWLPQSGQELRDFPCFFHYHNLFPQVAEHELITDIYLPLKD